MDEEESLKPEKDFSVSLCDLCVEEFRGALR